MFNEGIRCIKAVDVMFSNKCNAYGFSFTNVSRRDIHKNKISLRYVQIIACKKFVEYVLHLLYRLFVLSYSSCLPNLYLKDG